MLSANYAYAFDKDMISRRDAFNHRSLYNVPGRPNQFHHVALNIALEYFLGLPFQGRHPIQVREGKPGTDPTTWPDGWRWSPSRIPTIRHDLIPQTDVRGWWQPGTIEDVYQWDNPTSEDVIRDAKKLHEIKSELADVMIYCLNLTVVLGLDVEEIILNKVAHNEAKYPAHLMKQADSDDVYQKIKKEYRRKERGT